MIVTTGGRACSASSASSNASGSSSSSAACLIVTSRFSSVAISSTSSSESDCVAVFGAPRLNRILMMSPIETPSACEKSRRLTPDSTETGPVGGAAGARVLSRRGASSRPRPPWRGSRGRAAWLSMTTRRLRLPGPLPPRGRSGRFGLPPLAISLLSVKTCEFRIDPDGLSQHPRKPPLRLGPLEADQAPAGVGAAPRRPAAFDEHAVSGREAQELALWRAPAAADAAPHRLAHLRLVRGLL